MKKSKNFVEVLLNYKDIHYLNMMQAAEDRRARMRVIRAERKKLDRELRKLKEDQRRCRRLVIRYFGTM